MSDGLIFTVAGLTVAALSSVLGIWLQRDEAKPPRWGILLSLLILLASSVGMAQAWLDNKQSEKMEADMARMLATLDKLANSGDDATNAELAAILRAEISAQARVNPGVMQKIAQRVSDDGRDPALMLGAYLSASEVQALSRAGRIKTQPPTAEAKAVTDQARAKRELFKVAGEPKELVEKVGRQLEGYARAMADDAATATTKAAEKVKADAEAKAKKEAAKAKKSLGDLLRK